MMGNERKIEKPARDLLTRADVQLSETIVFLENWWQIFLGNKRLFASPCRVVLFSFNQIFSDNQTFEAWVTTSLQRREILKHKGYIMDFWTYVIIIVGAIVVGIIQAANKSKYISNNKKQMENHLGCIADFTATQKIIGSDGNTGLAIDENRKNICLIDHSTPLQKNVTSRVFLYKDILSSEIFEDGTTVTKTVRSSQIGGALVGGLALGGVGAIVGGLSGKTQTSDKVKKVDLRLTVNDTMAPIHDINFLDFETKKDGSLYKQAIQQARHWHGLIEVLIKRADNEDKAIITNDTPTLLSVSVADELKKLAELRDAGVLTMDEFQQQKSRLLTNRF